MRVVHTILFVIAAGGLRFAVFGTRGAHVACPPTRIVGACLVLLAVGLAAVARYQLGGSFSVTPQARKLVTAGVYARLRNPIYVASPLLLIGLSLALERWWPLLLLIVIVPVQIVRARREASVLRAAFGPEYDRYRAKTWF